MYAVNLDDVFANLTDTKYSLAQPSETEDAGYLRPEFVVEQV